MVYFIITLVFQLFSFFFDQIVTIRYVQRLKKKYSDKSALEHLSLQIDAQEWQQMIHESVQKTLFERLESTYGFVCENGILLSGVFLWIFRLSQSITEYFVLSNVVVVGSGSAVGLGLGNRYPFMMDHFEIWRGVIFLFIVSLSSSICKAPFEIYRVFVVEESWTDSFGKWLSAQLKMGFLAVVIGCPLLSLILWLINIGGGEQWLYIWVGAGALSVGIFELYPSVLLPLFFNVSLNKSSVLEDDPNNCAHLDLAPVSGDDSNGSSIDGSDNDELDGNNDNEHDNSEHVQDESSNSSTSRSDDEETDDENEYSTNFDKDTWRRMIGLETTDVTQCRRRKSMMPSSPSKDTLANTASRKTCNMNKCGQQQETDGSTTSKDRFFSRSDWNPFFKRLGIKENMWQVVVVEHEDIMNAFTVEKSGILWIVIYSPLLELSVEEVQAVIAHEVCHYQNRHSAWTIGLHLFSLGVFLFLFSLVAYRTEFYTSFGFDKVDTGVGLCLFSYMYSPVASLINMISNFVQRSWEFKCDVFAQKNHTNIREALISICDLNAGVDSICGTGMYSVYNRQHPSLLERIDWLDAQSSAAR